MARKCAISGIGPLAGNNRSHALNATRRKWNPNLQPVKIDGKTVMVRARAFKKLRKVKVAA